MTSSVGPDPLNHPLAPLLPEGSVLPRYDGASVANIPATIGQLLGVDEGWVGPALEPERLPFDDGVERVVLLLLDGIGWNRLQCQLEQDDAGFKMLLARHGASLARLTSVSPATTSVATTTLWGNGAAPAEHGMLGYTFLLPEMGLLANMLFWRPAGNEEAAAGELERWGVTPEAFLPTPSIAQVLLAGGVETTSLMPAFISNSPLSRMQMRGAKVQGYYNATDMWLQLRRWLQETTGRRGYAYAYYPDFDALSHRDGPDGAFWPALWQAFCFHLEDFLARLEQKGQGKTLLLITADHGHVPSPLPRRVFLQDHPELMQQLMLAPGGEARQVYLYARPGRTDAIRDYVAAHLSDRFFMLGSEAALTSGLYGPPGRLHPEALRRLGDFVLFPKGSHYLWDKRSERTLYGLHGGLEPDEMLVPLIGLRLDGS